MKLVEIRRETDGLKTIPEIRQMVVLTTEPAQLFLDFLEKHHFVRDHLTDLSYSLLELKVAIFQQDYHRMGRLVRKFTSSDFVNIKEVRAEINEFESFLGDAARNLSQEDEHIQHAMSEELHALLLKYKTILHDVEWLFTEIMNELEGSEESRDEKE